MNRLLRKTIFVYIATYMLVFVLTILLLMPIYKAAYDGARNVMERNLTNTLGENVERLAREMHTIDLYMTQLKKQSEIVSMAYLPNTRNRHVIDALRLQKHLVSSQYSNSTIVNDIVVLFDNSSYVISKSTVQQRDRYWGHTIGIDGMTQESFERALLEDRVSFFPRSAIGLNYTMRREDAVCFNYFSDTRLNTYYAICAVVTREALDELVMEPTVRQHGWMRITDANGNVIYENRAQDLGDCTEWTFTGSVVPLRMEVGVDNAVFTESVKGVHRLILMDCAVAFALVAILSVIMAQRIYRPIKDYVRFVNDQRWLDSETSMSSLRQCVRESTRLFTVNSDMLTQNLNKLRRQYRDDVLLSLTESESSLPMEQLSRCLGDTPLFAGRYVVVRLYTGEVGGTVALNGMNQAYRFATEQIDQRFDAYCVTNPRYVFFVSLSGVSIEDMDEKLEDICEQIASHQVRRQTVIRLARSSPHSGLEELSAACREVRRIILNLQPFVQEGRYLLRYEVHTGSDSAMTLSTFYPNTLYSVLLSGNDSAISMQMKELREQFTELYLSRPNRAPAFYYNIVSVFELVLTRLKGNLDIAEYDAEWTVEATCDYMDGMAHELGRMAAQRAQKPDVADEIIEYVDMHYCDSDMCLSLLSTRFKLSEAYISRMIKLKTGSTYTEYVELKRMNRAAELLRGTSTSVNDIALRLGYETPNTFFKAFKRVYHMPPGVYRESTAEAHTGDG